MKRKLVTIVLSVAVIASLVIVGCAPEAAPPVPPEEEEAAPPEEEEAPPAAPEAELYIMDLQAWMPGGSYYKQVEMFCERLERLSNGQIKVNLHAGGELCPSCKEFDALESGAIKWAVTCFNFNLGRLGQVATLTGAVPAGPNATELYAWHMQGDRKKLMDEIMESADTDVIVVGGPLHLAGAESFGWFKKPITSPDDFKGMKYRCMGLFGTVAKELGAAVVNLPGGEIYQAFERGVIDGFEYCTPSMDYSAGFQDLKAVMHEPGLQSTTAQGELMVRRDTWDAVPENLKTIIIAASEMSMIDYTWIHMQDAEAMVKFKEAGVEMVNLPEDVQMEIYNLVQEVHHEYCAKDPLYKKVYDNQQAFLDKYRIVEYRVQPEYRWKYE